MTELEQSQQFMETLLHYAMHIANYTTEMLQYLLWRYEPVPSFRGDWSDSEVKSMAFESILIWHNN